MNNATLGLTIGMVDSQGRPLFIPDYGDASQGFVGRILGRPVRLVTQMDNVATGGVAVQFGDHSQAYAFRQVNPGLGILRLNERYAAGFQVGFVAFARVGGISKRVNTTVPSPLLNITIK
jgi:HK97 family phage major capsid protein